MISNVDSPLKLLPNTYRLVCEFYTKPFGMSRDEDYFRIVAMYCSIWREQRK